MGRARFANLVSCLVARPFCAGEVVAESALSAPLVIQGGWLQKMEDTPEANARDHSLMVLARHCVKAPWQENLGSKNVKRSDFSDHWPLQMVSSRPIAVLCNSSSTHAVRKKTRAGGYAEEIVSLLTSRKVIGVVPKISSV